MLTDDRGFADAWMSIPFSASGTARQPLAFDGLETSISLPEEKSASTMGLVSNGGTNFSSAVDWQRSIVAGWSPSSRYSGSPFVIGWGRLVRSRNMLS